MWEPPSNFWIFIHWGRGIDSQMEMLLAVCDLFWVIITKFLNLECFTWAVKLRHWTQPWSMHTPPGGVRHLYDSHTTCVGKSDMSRKSLTSVSKKVFFFFVSTLIQSMFGTYMIFLEHEQFKQVFKKCFFSLIQHTLYRFWTNSHISKIKHELKQFYRWRIKDIKFD